MASLNRRGKLALFIASQALFLQIQTLPLEAKSLLSDTKEEGIEQNLQDTEQMSGQEGIATFYAKKYRGKRTASGSRYQPHKFTAAHASLPLGTKVRVVNLDNRKEVEVLVNDRCRARKTPFIDLSRAAAQKLGFINKGTARVQITPLDENS
jgi:rare lipoprotein A